MQDSETFQLPPDRKTKQNNTGPLGNKAAIPRNVLI